MKLKFADGADGLNRFLVLGLLILAMFIPLAFVDGGSVLRFRWLAEKIGCPSRCCAASIRWSEPLPTVPDT